MLCWNCKEEMALDLTKSSRKGPWLIGVVGGGERGGSYG